MRGADLQILISKKGAKKIIRKAPSKKPQVLSHDRTKQYILSEGTPYPFLVKLGVMTETGKVRMKQYHKFRQLNKYLEIVEACLPQLESKAGEPLKIVDFGSGKAYLTFALYHYLVHELNLNAEIVGLDLKADVVQFCNKLAEDLDYHNLKFYNQDIREFKATSSIDLVVSLHACDVATDYALAQAVEWKAKVILAVPCCQHELLRQIEQTEQKVLLEHGIIKERVAALITDSARAKILAGLGYDVTIMEFIDLEHTPKNLLIRAFLNNSVDLKTAKEEYLKFKNYWQIKPTLETLLRRELDS